MTVPETAVHLNDNAMFRKHEIGTSREVASVEPEAIAEFMSQFANGQLRSGMLAPHTRHHSASGPTINDIHVYRDRVSSRHARCRGPQRVANASETIFHPLPDPFAPWLTPIQEHSQVSPWADQHAGAHFSCSR